MKCPFCGKPAHKAAPYSIRHCPEAEGQRVSLESFLNKDPALRAKGISVTICWEEELKEGRGYG